MPLHVAEAKYLCATFAASGAYSDQVKQNSSAAFRAFEDAAKGGYDAAWFRLGSDYENIRDSAHAKSCFQLGVKKGVGACCYVSPLIFFIYN
jgi:TPR repeat protein